MPAEPAGLSGGRRFAVFTVNTQDKNPIYRQIMEQLILFVATGVMETGDKLPSIREMASDLGINPNTVARAYSELEQRGLIETVPKKGAFVADVALQDRLEDKAKEALAAVYVKYRQLGLEAEELQTIVKEAFRDAEYTQFGKEL